jgi:glycolate oxidase iron-sulfur subunit
MDSPRGRIYQVLQVDSGRLAIGDAFVTHIDRCLGCGGCESVCPSGVQYGLILERARAEIDTNYRRPRLATALRNFFFNTVLRKPGVLRFLARIMRFYQRSGLRTLARTLGILRLLRIETIEVLAPEIDRHFFYSEIGKTFPAKGERRGRVAFLAGCIANVSFAELNRATVRVLNENGFEVTIPAAQGCCGAMHAHAGRLEQARELARKNIDALLASGAEFVVSNAAGCGAMLKKYGELLEHDPDYAEKAHQFAAQVRDVNEYLAQVGLRKPRRTLAGRVTYQDACHLAHVQKVRSAPRELLKALGAELVEMPRADQCCGSAGTYNVVENELSMKILEAKMDDIATTGAEIVAASNVGCMIQLRAGVERRGLKMQVKHVVELLDECY